jgi:tripartite-type tricarboxylate transporter receptor subunit TctC
MMARPQYGFVVGIVLALTWQQPARAQAFPERPITLVVPSAAGGSTDLVGRILAEQLSSRFQQTVIVQNRPGSGGAIAATFVARSAPDGYTLLLANSTTLGATPILFSNVAYDPRTSFAPISGLTESPAVFVVNPSITAPSCPAFVQYAKANPGKVAYASSGIGSMPHLNGAEFSAFAGIDIVHVPYRGDAVADASVVAGETGMIFQSLGLMLPLIKTTKVHALGIATRVRDSRLPDVPTMVECGYPGFVSSAWTALLAPAKTPEPTIALLNETVVASLHAPAAREALAMIDQDPVDGSPQQLASRIAEESAHWSKVISNAHIRAE